MDAVMCVGLRLAGLVQEVMRPVLVLVQKSVVMGLGFLQHVMMKILMTVMAEVPHVPLRPDGSEDPLMSPLFDGGYPSQLL